MLPLLGIGSGEREDDGRIWYVVEVLGRCSGSGSLFLGLCVYRRKVEHGRAICKQKRKLLFGIRCERGEWTLASTTSQTF